LQSLVLATVPAKKEDPGYAALRGHIPKSLYKRFKMFCLERGVDNSQGLEELIHEYFDLKDQQEQEVSTLETPESNTSNASDSKESLPDRQSDRPDNPQPPESKPAAATKAKRGKASKEAG
jgi:hypothetical protein